MRVAGGGLDHPQGSFQFYYSINTRLLKNVRCAPFKRLLASSFSHPSPLLCFYTRSRAIGEEYPTVNNNNNKTRSQWRGYGGHTCNPSCSEDEARASQIQSQLGLHIASPRPARATQMQLCLFVFKEKQNEAEAKFFQAMHKFQLKR